MKNTFTILLLLISIEFTFAQSHCIISGNIGFPDRNYIVLHYADNYWLTNCSDTIKLKDNKSFIYDYKFSLPSKEVFLEINKKQSFQLWCVNNGNLIINIPDSVSQLEFLGSTGRIHQYMQSEKSFWSKIYKKYKERNPNLKNPSFTYSNEYFLIQDSITADRLTYLVNYFTNSPDSNEKLFINQKKVDFMYRDLYYKLTYNNPALERFKIYQTLLQISNPVTYKFSDQIDFNNEELLNNSSYLQFAKFFFLCISDKAKKTEWKKEDRYHEVFSIIDKVSTNKFCNLMLKAEFINEEINNLKIFRYSEGSTEQTYRMFVDLLKNNKPIENQVALIEQNLNKTIFELNSLKKGSPAPSFSLIDSTGNIIPSEKFKGKFILIDVWASWCGPCIQSIPEWNKLVEKYENNNEIVFITLSIDKSKTLWLPAMNKYKPKGLNFISYGDWDSEFSKKFNIRALPSNVLIDKEGKIIKIGTKAVNSTDLVNYIK